MGYKEEVRIDRNYLDIEWINQPVRFLEWAEKAVDAQFDRDKAKEQLDLVRAEVDQKIRASSKLSDVKITEAAVQSSILQDPLYVEASNKYLQTIKTAKILEVAKEAFEHRKKALEKLTDLWISGYWSDPRIRREARDQVSLEDRRGHEDVLEKNPRLRRRQSKESE